MSMPQVHIVAYCGDLGYGVARGSEMLALMLGLGSGQPRRPRGFWPTGSADRHAGARLADAGAGAAAVSVLRRADLALYVISAIFGLFQGGIVPMYAVISREFLPPREAGTRIGIIITATISAWRWAAISRG
jgi:hypothetical protein